MPNLWLIGMMGAGKTSVGRLVAGRLGMRFVDTDAEVEARARSPISELWRDEGEQAFRSMESAEVARLAAASGHLVAAGGGVVLRDENVAAMRSSGTVVWLDASPARLAARVGGAAGRPLLDDIDLEERLVLLLDERRGRYEAAAHHSVDTDEAEPGEVASEVVRLWTGS